MVNNSKKYSSVCNILESWVFDNFILADEPFAKALRIFENCMLVNNNLCGKLASSLELLINVMKVSELIDYHFLFLLLTYCCEIDNFMFKVLYWVILYQSQINL